MFAFRMYLSSKTAGHESPLDFAIKTSCPPAKCLFYFQGRGPQNGHRTIQCPVLVC